MKRILILLSCIFLLSGCSVEYNLEISRDFVKENIEIGKFDASNVKDFQYLTPYAIINDQYQEFYGFDYKNKVLNLTYEYDYQNIEMSEAINECYDMSNFSNDEQYYYILTSNEFKCLSYLDYDADEVKINIKSDYKIVSSNADYVKKSVHTWVINQNNSDNKPINIKFDLTETVYRDPLSSISICLMVVSVLSVIGVIVFIVYLFGRKRNKI